uniref:Hypodermin-A n=1 Tax=Hypoderma lineatum TaxID=7389 RepID=HYPA_HYPLI|nr:RecName: Full=Hypodermin-A; Short=HA; Flags: Precursor [Hypoderma lineatum]CAA52356.1 serine protease [Hypoderma lineatum]
MLKFVILLCSIAYVFGAVVPLGMLSQSDGRIVGGVESKIEDFPWQISLQRDGRHYCGGSIYSKNVIITAAHCLRNVVAEELRVRVGSSYWEHGGSLRNISKFQIHESYVEPTKEYDVALLKLDSDLSFNSTIKAIELTNEIPPEYADAIVSGWGETLVPPPGIPDQLRSVDVKIIHREKCASRNFGYGSNIKASMICAYAIGKDSCQGDSGGPLVVNNLLVGVVSWGIDCARPSYPGVYVDVSHVRSLIVSNAESI